MALLEPALALLALAAASAAGAALLLRGRAGTAAERAAFGRKSLAEGAGVAAGVLGLVVGAGALAAHPFSAPAPVTAATVSGPLTWLDVEPMGGDNTYSTKGGSLYDCLVMAGPMTAAARLHGCPLTSVPDGYQGRPTRLTAAGDQVVELSIAGLIDGTVTRPLPDPAAPARRARRWLDAAALLAVAGLALRLGRRRLPAP